MYVRVLEFRRRYKSITRHVQSVRQQIIIRLNGPGWPPTMHDSCTCTSASTRAATPRRVVPIRHDRAHFMAMPQGVNGWPLRYVPSPLHGRPSARRRLSSQDTYQARFISLERFPHLSIPSVTFSVPGRHHSTINQGHSMSQFPLSNSPHIPCIVHTQPDGFPTRSQLDLGYDLAGTKRTSSDLQSGNVKE